MVEQIPEWDVVVVGGINSDYLDTTGAGDAFSAALAVALAEGQSLADAGRFANGAAALSTTALGAQLGLPRREALESYLNRATAQTR